MAIYTISSPFVILFVLGVICKIAEASLLKKSVLKSKYDFAEDVDVENEEKYGFTMRR
ncbi:MAG: hypothetical protein LBE11_07445 [Prevotellaceae bacterium]|jgi:hypothetical protein|nr:hypothetical protein [Prevotellaceae bacterium]